MRHLANTVSIAAGALALLFGGIWLGGHPGSLPSPVRETFVDEDRAVRAEIIDLIEDNFYREVDGDKLRDDSLRGIVDGLDDRFSHYISPSERRRFDQQIAGEFEGVGVAIVEDRRGLKITRVFDRSPAQRAGIDQGQLVTRVDGRSIVGVSSKVSVARISGPAGTKVRLAILDPENGESRSLTVERAKIETPIVSGRMVRRGGREYGVAKLTSFSKGSHGILRRKVNQQLDENADGIVLDLRGNGGGLLTEGVLVASIFVEDGLITYTKGRTKPRRDLRAQGDAIDGDIPVVVLVDGATASASEIVTGALRDSGRGTVVGKRTFGKGVFQEIQPLSNGGVLDITVGEYFLPKGQNLGKRGIDPKVLASDDPDTKRDEALPAALRALASGR